MMAHEMFGSLEGLEEIFEKKPFKIGSYVPRNIHQHLNLVAKMVVVTSH